MKYIKRIVVSATLLMGGFLFFGPLASGALAWGGHHGNNDNDCANVQDVASHLWNGEAALLKIDGDKKLCKPLYVVGAAFEYVNPKPNDGSSGIWPQRLAGTTRTVKIEEPGNYILTTPDICGQRDLYAAVGSVPEVPKYMQQHGDNEPMHLHQFSKGVVTYSAEDPATCADQPRRDNVRKHHNKHQHDQVDDWRRHHRCKN